jgi:hypothetical protein
MTYLPARSTRVYESVKQPRTEEVGTENWSNTEFRLEVYDLVLLKLKLLLQS